MNSKDYIVGAVFTESSDFQSMLIRLGNQNLRLLHAVMGLSTEANEALDQMKKHIFYGKALDVVNLQEELGDIFWYAAILADVCGFTFEQTMQKNLAKLRARYPNKFTELDAVERDLRAEREVLEEKE